MTALVAIVVVDAVLGMLSLLAAVPALVFFAEIAAATRRRRDPPPPAAADASPRTQPLAVLMPAHDEALGIGPAIHAVLGQLGASDRLLVVADNCSDATAAVARAAGAEVVERHDSARRGKGYALDFGIRWLERRPPAAVVIVDADCIVAPGALDRLASRCLATARPVQALYLMRAPAAAGLGRRIAAFAWIVKNKLRPAGAAALGWPCQLMGTGMAFPWAMIRHAPLATGHLVEDMQLGLDLAAAGTAPLFCEAALVASTFPTDADGAASQRTRWEHGHLSIIADAGPRMLWRALSRGDPALLAMALDLMVPPLASLVLLLTLLCLLDAVWWAFAGAAAPFGFAFGGLMLVVTAVVAAWRREGRPLVGLHELAGLPLYVAAKLPIYGRLFSKRQVEWVRTKRDDRSR